jgi:AcrR family transcriptional regulator
MRNQITNYSFSGVIDPKQSLVLGAAWDCFAAYGFRKTSMQDIATMAGMSRPALYLHFRNKDDIFRALVTVVYDLAEQQIAEALMSTGSVADILAAALKAQSQTVMEAMLVSPHASELMEVVNLLATDLWMAGETRLRTLYAQWLLREISAGRITTSVTPDIAAEVITWSMKGLKSAGYSVDQYRDRVNALTTLLVTGLTG